MKVCITHIFHNCFVLDAGTSSYVFDIPAKRFRTGRAFEALQKTIADQDVTVFFTHSHLDHFAPDYVEVCSTAKSLKAVISDDIEEMYPELSFRNALIVEPDEKYSYGDVEIETLMSNDLGVAFIFKTREGLKVYNGGDLACWDWETASPAERNFTRIFFEEAVNRIADRQVQIAFSNVDRRLQNLAGGPQFIDKVQPQVFVPTHAFGRTQWLEGIHEKLGLDKERCFIYRRPGDSMCFEVDISRKGQ
ncbi:MBL fold metallo-hydrolase [Maridesulfovibrio hydrothermalis]|uniref:MBL fold metallo-hydrolase n=1 Tax=Maridesulfovibrio hydrothermalis AM13 = DSM 14728 TaxID=1121451 RepID=L0RDR8_9BACT|nr:hypothetical protein [Maridesulfovibrio hydrothermalis]CCO24345.1 conserved protein of unknown function [Maridesulfovibrio hydrothermalis AM13 = DSM 14728]